MACEAAEGVCTEVDPFEIYAQPAALRCGSKHQAAALQLKPVYSAWTELLQGRELVGTFLQLCWWMRSLSEHVEVVLLHRFSCKDVVTALRLGCRLQHGTLTVYIRNMCPSTFHELRRTLVGPTELNNHSFRLSSEPFWKAVRTIFLDAASGSSQCFSARSTTS